MIQLHPFTQREDFVVFPAFISKMHFGPLYLLVPSVYGAVILVQQDARSISWEAPPSSWSPNKFLGQDRSKFTISAGDTFSSLRALEIERKRQGYLYGPSLLGNTSYFPTGIMGDAMVQQHIDEWLQDASWMNSVVEEEAKSAAKALLKAGDILRLC